MFTAKQLGLLGEVIWGFLKKEMKILSHKHPQKEIYLFTAGKGFMQIDNRVFEVGKGDAIYISPNSVHSVWNNNEEDLEFILLILAQANKAKDLMPKSIRVALLRLKAGLRV